MRIFVIFAIVGFLLLAAVSAVSFLLFARRSESANSGETIGAARTEMPRATTQDNELRDQMAALSERVDRLASEIEQLRMSSTRAGVPAPMPEQPTSDAFVAAHRDDVFRLIAEDEALRALPARRTEFAQALAHAFNFYSIPNPNGKELGESVRVLLETETRKHEIVRRIVPPHESADADGPWKSALDAEMVRLRAWRESELARVVGADAARKLASSLGSAQRL